MMSCSDKALVVAIFGVNLDCVWEVVDRNFGSLEVL